MKKFLFILLLGTAGSFAAWGESDQLAYHFLKDNAQPLRSKVTIKPTLKTEHTLPLIIDMVYSNPGEPRTVTRFNNHDELKRWGFNGQSPQLQVQCAITMDSFDPKAVPQGSKERQWIEHHAEEIHHYIKAGKKRGLMMIPFTDILVLPKSVYEKYKEESGNLDLTKPVTQKMIRCWLNEIFDRFPELDGLMLRFGETYLHDTPYHRGKSPVKGLDQHVQLLKILREEVCVKRNKKIIYRTWGWDGFHTNVSFYKKATSQIKPHPNLIFSIKHTQGDFLRRSHFNPTLGIGEHDFIVEIQNQREYEGKGAYPNYIGNSVLNGYEEDTSKRKYHCVKDLLTNQHFKGIFNWTRGGGWRGPYIKNELWIMLNAYVIGHWANDPTRSEEEIFKAFASEVLGLDDKNTQRFREIALLSAEGVLLGQYSLSYPYSPMWNRDQYYNAQCATLSWGIKNNRYEEVLKEKAEAVKIWKKIVTLSKNLEVPDPKLKKMIEVSCQYGYYKYAVIEKAWTVISLGKVGDKKGSYDKPRMTQAAKAYFRLWKEWEQLLKDHPDVCASLYEKNGCRYYHQEGMFSTRSGMDDSTRQYITQLHLDVVTPPAPAPPIPRKKHR
jgi:hypothetical protein